MKKPLHPGWLGAPQTPKEKNEILKARRAEKGITRRSYWGSEETHLKYRKIEAVLLAKAKNDKVKKKKTII